MRPTLALLIAAALASAGGASGRAAARSVAGNGRSGSPSISADGRFVAFESRARNLVAGDTNRHADVFVRDRLLGTTRLVSIGGRGPARGESRFPAIAANGRFVAFASRAPNLVAGDRNGTWDVFVSDRLRGKTVRVSVGAGGREAHAPSSFEDMPAISADGRFVAFTSAAVRLVDGHTSGRADVFVRDRRLHRTERVSQNSHSPSISGDGRFVAYFSAGGVFVRDRVAGRTEPIAENGSEPAISADGRYVAFTSLDFAKTPVAESAAVYDRRRGTTDRVAGPAHGEALSATGRHVSYVGLMENNRQGIFVRDRVLAKTERISVGRNGELANSDSFEATLSGLGSFVAFTSTASNLVRGDANRTADVFVRDRRAHRNELISVARR